MFNDFLVAPKIFHSSESNTPPEALGFLASYVYARAVLPLFFLFFFFDNMAELENKNCVHHVGESGQGSWSPSFPEETQAAAQKVKGLGRPSLCTKYRDFSWFLIKSYKN